MNIFNFTNYGEAIPDEELDEKLPEWLKSSGQNKL